MKYTMTALLVTTSLILLCSSCKKTDPPTACIAATPDTAYVNKPVRFASCSVGATDIQWHFGDSSVALTDTATHIYTQPGTYHGTMIAANTSKSVVKDFIIIVLPDTPGYYMINGRYYRLNGWVNDADGVQGRISVVTSEGIFVNSTLSLYFYGGNSATPGDYNTSFGYISQLQPGQMTMGASLDTTNNPYSSSASNTEKVKMEILPSGKKHITCTDVWMVDFFTMTDSFKITLDIKEP